MPDLIEDFFAFLLTTEGDKKACQGCGAKDVPLTECTHCDKLYCEECMPGDLCPMCDE